MSNWIEYKTPPESAYFKDFSKQKAMNERGKPRLPKGKLCRKADAQTSPSLCIVRK